MNRRLRRKLKKHVDGAAEAYAEAQDVLKTLEQADQLEARDRMQKILDDDMIVTKLVEEAHPWGPTS
jgi:hypothetical protein